MADLERALERARDFGAQTLAVDVDDLEAVLVVVVAAKRAVDQRDARSLDLLAMAVGMYEVDVAAGGTT